MAPKKGSKGDIRLTPAQTEMSLGLFQKMRVAESKRSQAELDKVEKLIDRARMPEPAKIFLRTQLIRHRMEVQLHVDPAILHRVFTPGKHPPARSGKRVKPRSRRR